MLVKIISIMLGNTYTTDDLVERLGLMRTYYNERLFVEGSTATLQQVLGGQCEQHTLESLMSWEAKFLESEIQPLIVYESLGTVQEELTTMPAVVLYVPLRFPPEHVERIGTWFRENVQPNILVSLKVDPRATGGCSIVWKDRYYDFSLHYFIQDKREEVVQMFNTHMHETSAS